MAGQIKLLIDSIVEQRAKGNPTELSSVILGPLEIPMRYTHFAGNTPLHG